VANTDGSINGAAGATITGAAYTNNTAGASTTVLYDLDPATDQLYRQDPPNDGTLVPVGALNLNITGDGGFDIDAKTGTALGLYSVQGKPTLFAVDLATGAARRLAEFAANLGYTGLAIPTQPVAYAVVGGTGGSTNLLIFNPTTPAVRVSKPVTGLGANEFVVGLDFRPANGQLYALALLATGLDNTGQLYTINAATGAATLVGSLNTPVSSTVGFDFNPVADRIRIFSGLRNLRVNPDDASVIVDGNIISSLDPNPIASINVFNGLTTAAAYDNNFAGATSTTLYAINSRTQQFLVFPSPNTGQYNQIGSTTIVPAASASNGFDIGGMSNMGYGIFSSNAGPEVYLYSFDIPSGKATILGPFTAARGFTIGLGF
jgi:hypothetical protein